MAPSTQATPRLVFSMQTERSSSNSGAKDGGQIRALQTLPQRKSSNAWLNWALHQNKVLKSGGERNRLSSEAQSKLGTVFRCQRYLKIRIAKASQLIQLSPNLLVGIVQTQIPQTSLEAT